jgi:hypothetical protein
MTETSGAILPTTHPESSLASRQLERIRAQVSVSATPQWVVARELDETYRAPGGGPYSYLLLDHQRRFTGDACYQRTVRRVETLQGVQEAAHWSIDFDPGMQSVVLHSIAVRRGSEVTEHARAERLRVVQREDNLERGAVDRRASVVVLLDDVRVGDIIDASFTLATTARATTGRHWFSTTVPADYSIRAFHVRVLFPSDWPMRWMSDQPKHTPAVRELAPETEWSWEVQNTQGMEAEPNLPAWYLHGRWFQVSDFASWGEVAAGFLAAWPEDFNSAELEETAERIAAESSSPADRAERAMRLVQDEIRSFTSKEDFAATIPASPGTVLQRRSASGKEKAFLLAHLLRRMGISARLMLVHSERHKLLSRSLPLPDVLNHAIVEFEIDGKRGWCDPTLTLQGGGAFGRTLPVFSIGLPISQGVVDLEPIRPKELFPSVRELHETFYLDTAGRSSAMTMLLQATGGEADYLRRRIALDGVEAVARRREKFYQGMFPDLKRVNEFECRDDREKNEVMIGATYDLLQPFEAGAQAKEVVFRFRAHLVQSVLSLPTSRERTQPLALRFPCDFHQTIEIQSPAITARSPERRRPPGSEFFFGVDVRAQAGRLSYDFTVRTVKDAVEAGHYAEHSRIVRDLWPLTEIELSLPTGTALPRRRKMDNVLPPPSSTPSSKEQSGVDSSAAPRGQLPSAPAALLTSIAREEPAPAEETATAESAHAGTEGTARPLMRQSKVQFSAATEVPTRKRSRKRKHHSGVDRTWLFLVLIIGLVVVSMIVAMSMNKK